MASADSTKAVVAALAGNAFVTLIKLVAFVLSGSGAMLSEAIHSGADTANQLLLFLGLKRSTRARDDEFHYGYGGERFVFGILSAAGIFFVGCGVTVYHGVHSLLDPHMPELGPVTFGVLGVSLLIEGTVLIIAIRSIQAKRGATPFFAYVRESADPATVAILLEDGVAVSGVIIVTLSSLAAILTGIAALDGVASIVIGLLLGFVAIYLVLENRTLLLGKAVPEGVAERFGEILARFPSVESVQDVKTLQLTPEAYKLKAEVRFRSAYFDDKLRSAEGASPGSPAARVIRMLSEEIDAMEKAVRVEIPQARHIDIEVDQSEHPAPSTQTG